MKIGHARVTFNRSGNDPRPDAVSGQPVSDGRRLWEAKGGFSQLAENACN